MSKPSLKRMRRRLLFHLLRRLAWLVSYCGFHRLALVGRWLGQAQFNLSVRTRRNLKQRISAALGPEVDSHAILQKAFRENTRAILEVLAMYSRRLPDHVIEAACAIEGLEHIQGLNGGAILLGTHSGNGVLLPVRLALMGHEVCVAVRESGKIPRGFYVTGQSRYGVRALDAGAGSTGLKTMIRALRQGALLYILMDQGVKRNGTTVEFLGRPFQMPGGPALLARRCAVPVIPAPTIAAGTVWRFRLETPVWLEQGGGATHDADTARLARVSEQQIRQQPDLWTWHHRRWGRTA